MLRSHLPGALMQRFLDAITSRTVILAAAIAAVFALPHSGLDATDSALENANLAWQRGDYVAALTIYSNLLNSPDAEAVLEPIALQTGELYQTVELTRDGAAPQFSPDGRHIVYESGNGLERVTRVLRADGSTQVIAELPGTGASFSPDGSKLAYLKLAAPSAALKEAQAAADSAPAADRQQRQAAANRLLASEWQIVIRDLASGAETPVNTGTLGKTAVRLGANGTVLFAGVAADSPIQIYVTRGTDPPTAVTTGEGDKDLGDVSSKGTLALYSVRGRGGRGGGGGGGGREGTGTFGIISVGDGKASTAAGSAPTFSADESTLAYVSRQGSDLKLMAGPAADPAAASSVRSGGERIDAPALSADGKRIAFQLMAREDWELFLIDRDGKTETRLTREIQHDLVPQFLSPDRILAVMGEPRHRRSYVYDVASDKRSRLFHNNTVRTIAPEYAWIVDPTGPRVLISAERDGDTVSPERGIYLVDLSKRVTLDALRSRVAANLAAEQALRAMAQRMYAPIATQVKEIVALASVDRIFGYEERLFSFDSKHITRPGNKLAAEYLLATYRSFGYDAELQAFSPRNALGGQTANVLATLRGTSNPELIYVAGSHFDSVAGGPGADDDSSGTAALLETARIMAKHPQPATIVFASFTGEEGGLLGSREFVRQEVEKKVRLVGALNNDMVGWANDQRLDNTIRYSNRGIRDVQHSAAMLFTNLITYDALYYKSTDAAAFYDAYGDIVGGIGSYPVLGNPHYHQSHDVLETINHQLVTEVAKTTAATLMLLASSPSRLTGLAVTSSNGGSATLSWNPSPEKGITGYIVAYGPADKPDANQIRVTVPTATLSGVSSGLVVSVKAVNEKGLEGWDWARLTLK
jgi:Tol biopolymer transport system component